MQDPRNPQASSSRQTHSTHARSSSDVPSLPMEIFHQIFENVPRTTLTSVARTNTSFNEVSEKLIYRHLELTTISQAIQCFQTLQKKPQAAKSVREFVIMIRDTRSCVQNLGPLLSTVLRSMTQLTSLHVAIEGPYLPALNGCTFPRLTTFSSIADLSPNPTPLVEFFIRHPTITSVCLGGETPSNDPSLRNAPPFSLPPSALPSLTSYMGSRRLASIFVPGRPVKRITLAWHSQNVELEVRCIVPPLGQASVPVASFSVATPGWSPMLIRALAMCLPSLQSLRLHNVSADYYNEAELFAALTSVLHLFSDLTRLELPCHRNIRSVLDADTEARTAKQWSDLTPRLQAVVFPSSRAWHRTEKGAWEPV
ncbi:uncharacterized protein FOMMEDRAFT_22071 [Fomitiporia mediterranea MF3/22]|uniref:uncharacterized protein n=1 Tax=Fomitiporia mediterranea (strain MF3/22) TaxID=694068 RepID=UPI0004409B99|nr:uncharacterized protein FOMMEDRAFT_22071 [Fomitiporia mediterranea MF3/22]EJD01709.1 hypothetical protein FOMMEDRAFT_22071 [Fomitiporia mediterranea MF3/22]